MIRFRCRCEEPFEVPDELAGTSLQCPNCGLLVDVPTIDDLPGLEAGGTYKLHETPLELADEPVTARRIVGAGTDTPSVTARHDANDRRMSLNEFLNIGTTEEDLLALKDEAQPGIPKHPKYDPITGELILPLDVRRDEKKEAALVAIPAAPAVLSYERRDKKAEHSIWWPFAEMFRLPNLIVCTIVTLAFYFAMAWFFAMVRFFFPVVLSLPLVLMTIAHFANIVDETGPTGTDEIPRPMRGANIYDDFIKPLAQVVSAYLLGWAPVLLMICYVPVTRRWFLDLGLLAGFFVIVPALLITLITSGALNNLLPNRALSVIPAAGKDYWAMTIVGAVATVAFLIAGLLAANAGDNLGTLMFTNTSIIPFRARPVFPVNFTLETTLAPLAMFVAVYLVHVFCWQMGIVYRRYHESFSWVLQKHDKSARTDTLAQLHMHRQRELEAKAAEARRNMQQRAGGRGALPVAKPAQREG